MEARRQHDYLCTIPPAEQQPRLHDREDNELPYADGSPFRTFLATTKEPKALIANDTDRSVWFRLILQTLAASALPPTNR
jgi:hypothetical protein